MSGFNDFMNKAGAFASKAAEKAKDLAGVAAAKTKQLSRVAKLNMDISGQKDVIKKAYMDLGKLYYESYHDAPGEGFAQACQEIDIAKAAIASMEEEIAAVKAAAEAAGVPVDGEIFEDVVDATEAAAGIEVEIVQEAAPAEEAAPAAEAAPAKVPTPAEEAAPGKEAAPAEEPVPAQEPKPEEGPEQE